MKPMLPSKSSLIRRKTLSSAAGRTTQGTLKRSANTTQLLWKTQVDAVSLMKAISPTTSPSHQMPYLSTETLCSLTLRPRQVLWDSHSSLAPNL